MFRHGTRSKNDARQREKTDPAAQIPAGGTFGQFADSGAIIGHWRRVVQKSAIAVIADKIGYGATEPVLAAPAEEAAEATA